MSGPINYIPQPIINIPDQYYLGKKQSADLAQAEALTQQTKAVAEQEQLKAQRQNSLQKDLQFLTLNPESSSKDYADMVLKYPELDKHFKEAWELLNEDAKTATLKETQDLYSAVSSSQIDIATKMLEDKKQAAINSGNQEEADEAGVLLTKLKEPGGKEYVQAQLGTGLASIMGPNNFASVYNALNKEESNFRTLSKNEKITAGLDPNKPYQLDTKTNKISEVGGSGTTVNVGAPGKFGQIPEGYYLVSDGKGGFTMSPVPGSPAADAAASAQTQKQKSQKIIVNAIDDALNIIKSKPFVTGVVASKVGPEYNQARTNLQAKLDTVKSQVGFDKLMEIKQSSKTGGGLGAVSNEEMKILQESLGSLDAKQDQKELRKTLGTIRKLMSYPGADNILSGTRQSTVSPSVKGSPADDPLGIL